VGGEGARQQRGGRREISENPESSQKITNSFAEEQADA
jgi:protein required for attachment to host cells